MKSAFNPGDRRDLVERLMRLRPDARAVWGRMTAPQMVTHLADSLYMAFGELPVTPKRLPIRYPPLKQLLVYFIPIPKGVPTAPELIARTPGDWQAGVTELRTLLERFATRTAKDAWPDHPAFGRLTPKQWGVLAYRHTDHHLRQFGV
jgi:hypothetical protein